MHGGVDDLVNRKFHRLRPNSLWVTDITERPTREGKVYCCAVMDTYSGKIVGWSIDNVQNAQLVVNALDMAIKARRPVATIVHADHGTQGGFNWSSQHLEVEVWDGSTVGDAYDCEDVGCPGRALTPAYDWPSVPWR